MRIKKEESGPRQYTYSLEDISLKDSPAMGGKNAALGELHQCLKNENMPISPSFAVTAKGYWDFLTANAMVPEIESLLDSNMLVSEIANTSWIGTLRKKRAKALVTDLGGGK